MNTEFSGKRIVLTGASGGIGRVVAQFLAQRGASLALLGRGAAALESLVHSLPGGPHETLAFDVRDETAWRANVGRLAPSGELDGLVTAAGSVSPIGVLGTWSIESFRATIETNLIGTVLAIDTCLPALRAARGAVVTFSGGGATSPLARFDAYASSKAAVVRLTENLARALEDDGIRLNAVAPGFVLSAMHDEELAGGLELVGPESYARTIKVVEDKADDPPELAAELVCFLLSQQAWGISGKLLSAKWDPWHEESFQTKLRKEPDLATLRRIDNQFFSATES